MPRPGCMHLHPSRSPRSCIPCLVCIPLLVAGASISLSRVRRRSHSSSLARRASCSFVRCTLAESCHEFLLAGPPSGVGRGPGDIAAFRCGVLGRGDVVGPPAGAAEGPW
eukprot:3644211-Alexandrium_andersonii.AAC.1